MDLHHLILSHDEEKIQLKKENEKLKKEKEEYEAVEQFIMQCFRNNNFDEALHAHYREGKVIDFCCGLRNRVIVTSGSFR